MKKTLLLLISILMTANVAMADHVGIYSDASGQSCLLSPGFTFSTVVVHKTTSASTGIRFRLDFSGAPGTVFLGSSSNYAVIRDPALEFSVAYQACLSPSMVALTITATLAPGTIRVMPAPGFATVVYFSCDYGEHPATAGSANVGGVDPCNPPLATENATWGKVKSLYR